MPKGYWITSYRSTVDPTVLAKYAELAGAAIAALGGRILARGDPARTYEEGLNLRCVVIEFDTVEDAIVAYQSPEYQAALAVLKGSAHREVRIMEGS